MHNFNASAPIQPTDKYVIECAADNAADAMAATIQASMGIEFGHIAGAFFNETEREVLREMAKRLLAAHIAED